MYKFRGMMVPEHMQFSLDDYIQRHIPTGDFLREVISNNLCEACSRADDVNLRNLPAFVAYLYNNAPANCWGSPEAYKQWVQDGDK